MTDTMKPVARLVIFSDGGDGDVFRRCERLPPTDEMPRGRYNLYTADQILALIERVRAKYHHRHGSEIMLTLADGANAALDALRKEVEP